MTCLEETQIASLIRNTKFGLFSQAEDIQELQINPENCTLYTLYKRQHILYIENSLIEIFFNF